MSINSIIERFEDKYIPEPNSGCWLWIASKTKFGYGQFKIEKDMRLAHRISFKLYKGEIPKGLHVLHTCDVRCCVNPEHLVLGTHTDNMRDMFKKNRHHDRRGELHPASRLSSVQVLEIRKKYEPYKYTIPMLSKEYFVSISAIEAVVFGRSWKHLERSEDV